MYCKVFRSEFLAEKNRQNPQTHLRGVAVEILKSFCGFFLFPIDMVGLLW